MSIQSGGWRESIDDIDAVLVDGYQSDVPIAERPFERIGDALGIDESETVERVQRLHDDGIFRRFGPVLNPPVIGSSTLAAVRAPDGRFEDIADIINGYRQVNHNYARDHEWNMWFVVTAGTRAKRDEIIAEIEAKTGCTVLTLPMRTDYYIDLEFPVVNADRFARQSLASDADLGSATDSASRVTPTRVSEDATTGLSPFEADLLLEVQDGFPLSQTPYQDVAASLETDIGSVLEAIKRLREIGCIKRIGCVVNHLVTGFDANCMVVWDVPDDELDERGVRAGGLPYVTLCYHRPRRPELEWPYNLFTMIHGRDPQAVDEKIDELAAEYLPVSHERLYSTETLKQTGAQYDQLLGRRD